MVSGEPSGWLEEPAYGSSHSLPTLGNPSMPVPCSLEGLPSGLWQSSGHSIELSVRHCRLSTSAGGKQAHLGRLHRGPAARQSIPVRISAELRQKPSLLSVLSLPCTLTPSLSSQYAGHSLAREPSTEEKRSHRVNQNMTLVGLTSSGELFKRDPGC